MDKKKMQTSCRKDLDSDDDDDSDIDLDESIYENRGSNVDKDMVSSRSKADDDAAKMAKPAPIINTIFFGSDNSIVDDSIGLLHAIQSSLFESGLESSRVEVAQELAVDFDKLAVREKCVDVSGRPSDVEETKIIDPKLSSTGFEFKYQEPIQPSRYVEEPLPGPSRLVRQQRDDSSSRYNARLSSQPMIPRAGLDKMQPFGERTSKESALRVCPFAHTYNIRLHSECPICAYRTKGRF